MHTYTHSFLGGVRGPYCASQRKCRHSRGQAIHWSEYRLLHFSASLLCYPTLSLPFFFFLSQPIAFSALCASCTPISYNFGIPMIYHLLFVCIFALSVTSLSLTTANIYSSARVGHLKCSSYVFRLSCCSVCSNDSSKHWAEITWMALLLVD